MKLLGIDDAGRGPVIGPMILAGVLTDPKEEPKIKAMGAKDSKLLTPIQRKKIKTSLRANRSDDVLHALFVQPHGTSVIQASNIKMF